ncbi:amino acid dehydrogenase, partial [Escherichia coli]|nr:amino acid dehydrogenase [Escherichia coli]
GLWKVGMMAGAHAASWFINGGKTPLKFGAISDWMEARDLPEADGESFRSWFKKHLAQEKKNG